MKQELTYWLTLALIPGMWTKRKNELYVQCFTHEPRLSIIDLFESPGYWDELGFSAEEKEIFEVARGQLAQNSFLAEELQAQGYEILPLDGPDYPSTLKQNLGTGSPSVLFVKGNKDLFNQNPVAIVGSRNADAVSLGFTDTIARQSVTEGKSVVSGFAKGVDRKALDSAFACGGSCIVVLPQGIMTFGSGFKEYYRELVQGRLLVVSAFAPKAPWSVELAMARNPLIYGLANEIFVARSDDKGGTWAGVIQGLRKKRQIYVRWPEQNENCANRILVQKGAIPVSSTGTLLQLDERDLKSPEQLQLEQINRDLNSLMEQVDRISPKELISRLNLDWKDDKMKRHLENLPGIEKIKEKNRIYFRKKGRVSPSLFE